MIDKEHLKTRLRKFLEEECMDNSPGLCVYLVRGIQDLNREYATWNFLRQWFDSYRVHGSGYVDRLYTVTPKRLQLAQKLLDELEESDISDGTPDNPDIN